MGLIRNVYNGVEHDLSPFGSPSEMTTSGAKSENCQRIRTGGGNGSGTEDTSPRLEQQCGHGIEYKGII